MLGTKTGAEAAVADEYRRRAVAHHLGQGRLYVDLKVEVRVNVEHAGDEPLITAIDHLRGGVGGQAVASCRDLAVAHGYVLNAG